MYSLRLFFAPLLVIVATLSSPVAWAGISAGIAVVDITPPLGGLRVGYGSPIPSEGVQVPLTARVMVLESGETSVALVVWDLCVAGSPWLHERVAELGIDRLLLLNTHTHSGPHLDQPDFPASGGTLRADTEKKVLAAIKEAQAAAFPASFAAAEGSIQLGYNRLERRPGGSVTHFDNPERIPYGPVDPTLGVIRVTDGQGVVRAVLVNYACHPVVLGPTNRHLSPDYPGVMRREVEAAVGGSAVCFFLQGAAGEINPLMLGRSGDAEKDLAVVETMGKTLATEVIQVLATLQSTPGKSDDVRMATKTFAVENRWESVRKSDEPQQLEMPWRLKSISVSATTLLVNGDIGILALPGEPFQAFQGEWRQKSGLPHAYLLGYCAHPGDPWAGYIPDVESAARGGFGASDSTHVAVGTGERLVTEGLIQLYRLQGRLRAEPKRHLREE